MTKTMNTRGENLWAGDKFTQGGTEYTIWRDREDPCPEGWASGEEVSGTVMLDLKAHAVKKGLIKDEVLRTTRYRAGPDGKLERIGGLTAYPQRTQEVLDMYMVAIRRAIREIDEVLEVPNE